ncbi:PREDICTED: uncharacterized protein LOC101304737 [Fragaria vesca subsp. vesca]|uniref:uncharacterized protein LOC101304737 n=1 Tax=Fragaria vesca subsp. vesca TaxID=101020 RepID=UPI0002C373F5|nr:PREDICTED: uncharacterized protein LOC101304737 [Fragaria vesca subsp. vesca]
MARLAAQANVKSLFNGEGVPSTGSGSDPKDPFSCMFTFSSLKPQKRRLTSLDSTRIYSSSSASNKTKRLNAEVRLFFGDEVADKKGGLGDSEYDDVDDDDEFERDDLSCFRGLVLDISYRPINVVCWKRAICLEFMDKADVLEYYDQTVNSPSGSFYIPAVLRVPHLLQVVKRRRIKCNLSRKNILCRDSFTCQYCSSRENLTIDHVIPIARGGEWKWDNLVTACAKCNSKKGQKTVEEACMKLMKIPKAPKDYDILAIPLTNAAVRMLRMRKGTPEEWLQYLSNSSMP